MVGGTEENANRSSSMNSKTEALFILFWSCMYVIILSIRLVMEQLVLIQAANEELMSKRRDRYEYYFRH